MTRIIFINVDATDQDLSAHLRRTLEKEQEEKARRKKERAEAHLYTVARVAQPADIAAEVGESRFFDLVEQSSVLFALIFEIEIGHVGKQAGTLRVCQLLAGFLQRANKIIGFGKGVPLTQGS